MKKIINGVKYKIDSYDVKQNEGERVCDEVVSGENCTLRKKFVLVYSSNKLANLLVPVKDLSLIEDFDCPQEKCPSCGSDNIANEDSESNSMLFVTCHDCSFQWDEPVIKQVEWKKGVLTINEDMTNEAIDYCQSNKIDPMNPTNDQLIILWIIIFNEEISVI
jgi:hypothetical protein